MTAVTKFLFDTKFETLSQTDDDSPELPDDQSLSDETLDDTANAEEEEELPGYSEAQLEAAKAESFEAGKQEGIREAASTIEKDMLMTIQAISLNITELFGRQEQANNALLRDGIGIASTIAKKLFPAMNEQNALGEIDRMVEHTLHRLIEEPRVVIRVNPDLMTPLGDRVDGLKAGAGYEGRIIIKEDAALPYGNCRMEWGDGSAERNVASLWQSIDQIIAGNLGVSQRQDDEQGVGQGAVEISDVLVTDTSTESEAEGTQQADVGQTTEENTVEGANPEAAPSPSSTDGLHNQQQDAAPESVEGNTESDSSNEDGNAFASEKEDSNDPKNPPESMDFEPNNGESMNSKGEGSIVNGMSATDENSGQETGNASTLETARVNEILPDAEIETTHSDDDADG